jgi:uncharacterized membrane protein
VRLARRTASRFSARTGTQARARAEARTSPAEHRALSAMLIGSGIGHLVRPAFFDQIVPRRLPPSQRFWTLASGVAEIGVGLAVADPRTRRAGGYAAAGLFVAVFPANVWMAWLWRRKPLPYRVGALARLPLQVPLVAWGLRVARSAAPRG